MTGRTRGSVPSNDQPLDEEESASPAPTDPDPPGDEDDLESADDGWCPM